MTSNIKVIKRYLATIVNLKLDQEAEQKTFDEVRSGVVFKGTNFWVMALAIFISCIGLNINSKTAVIGAMIISPLMGPIFGIGFGLGSSNLGLLKLSFQNVFRIVLLCVSCATVYNLLSPSYMATPELLSFAKPTIFDVLLALLGGMAAMIAISRHDGSRVLVGVAVATACIPPLCTAGYGLATWQLEYVLGGLYTYFINALFICLGCFLITKYLKFSRISQQKIKYTNTSFGVLSALAIAPALYFAYNLYNENVFTERVKFFVEKELSQKHHVFHTETNVAKKSVTVDLMVDHLDKNLDQVIARKLIKYGLDDVSIIVNQSLTAKGTNAEIEKLKKEIDWLKVGAGQLNYNQRDHKKN